MTVVVKGFNSLLMVNLRPSIGQKSNYARCLAHHHLAVKFRTNEANGKNGAQCRNVRIFTTSNFLRANSRKIWVAGKKSNFPIV